MCIWAAGFDVKPTQPKVLCQSRITGQLADQCESAISKQNTTGELPRYFLSLVVWFLAFVCHQFLHLKGVDKTRLQSLKPVPMFLCVLPALVSVRGAVLPGPSVPSSIGATYVRV